MTLFWVARARTKSSEKGVPASQWVPAGVEGSKDDDGQEADFITLNPIFDVKGSGWYWSYDVQSEFCKSIDLLSVLCLLTLPG